MTFVHKLTKLGSLLLLSELRGLAGRLEVLDTLTLSKDVHGTLIEEELGVLRLDFLDVRDVAHDFEDIVDVGITLELSRSVATRSELVADQLEHAFLGLVKEHLEFLEGGHAALIEAIDDAGAKGQQLHAETALDNSLVVPGADGEDLSGRGQ